MAKNRICPDCGRSLPEDALAGVCPVCSLQSALTVKSAGGPQVAHASSQGAQFPSLNSQAGTRFGDYELLELLARGGMGVVYKARQISLNRTVALKMIQAGVLASPAEVKRFHAEAEAVAHLQHPNIVAIHEIGEHEGHHYFSMDYVAGRTLAEIVRDGPLLATRAAAYVKTIAAAVHHAHQHGIIHRDLKPANVIIDEHDEPRITDFGLAKRLSDSQFSSLSPQLTLSGQVLGSPNYLPPEQAEPKRGGIGPPSDVYALGAILYHLALGRPPFQAESLTTLLRQVIETEPVAPRSLNPSLPRDLETICLKCLEKEIPRRYSTAQELADDLERFLENKPIQALPVSAAGKAWKWCRRRPALAGLSATLVLTLVAGLTLALWQLQQTRTGELMAKQNAYAADMNLAQVAVESGDLGAAMALLDAHRPAPGQRDLRGWEWRYFWQRCRSDELFELTNSPVTIDQVLFTPDGRWLAARDERSNLTLWDLGSRRQIRTFKMHGYLDPFAFSQKGNLLAYYAAGTPAVTIASLDTQQEIARLAPTTHVAHVAFSADASRLFSLDEHGTLIQWDIATQQPLGSSKFPGTEYNLELVTISPDAKTIAFRLWNGLGLWEPESGRQTQIKLGGAESAPTILKFSPDGKLLAAGVGASDSQLYVWSVEDLWRSGEAAPPPRGRFGPHRDWISGVAFSTDSRSLVSASADSALQVWEFDRPDAARRFQGHRHQVLSVAWSADGQRIVSSGKDGSVRVWDPRREPAVPGPRVLPVSSLMWCFGISRDGMRALVLDKGTAVLWDTESIRPAEALIFAGTNNTAVAWSPDSKTLATGDGQGNVRIWDLASRREITNAVVPRYLVGHLHFSYDGRFLACGGLRPGSPQSRLVKLLEVKGWHEIPLPHEALDDFLWGDLAPEVGLFVALHWGGALDVWDIHSGQCRAHLRQPLAMPNELGMIWFAPDGRTWATFTQRGVLCLWDGDGQRTPFILPRSAQELWHVAFSADGTRLLVSGKRASDVVRLLDLNSKRIVASLSGKADQYWHVGMSRDNSTVFAVGSQSVLLWRAPSWDEIEAAEKGSAAP